MSSYFDEKGRELDAIQNTAEGWDAIRTFEISLVFDISVCAMFPDFPCRAEVQDTILRFGVYSLPDNAPPADFETFDDHVRRMSSLLYDLHSIFHEVARHDGWIDSPKYPLRLLAMRAHEERAARFPPLEPVKFE